MVASSWRSRGRPKLTMQTLPRPHLLLLFLLVDQSLNAKPCLHICTKLTWTKRYFKFFVNNSKIQSTKIPKLYRRMENNKRHIPTNFYNFILKNNKITQKLIFQNSKYKWLLWWRRPSKTAATTGVLSKSLPRKFPPGGESVYARNRPPAIQCMQKFSPGELMRA